MGGEHAIDVVRVSGRHLSLETAGGPDAGARAVVNLVAVEGPGAIAISPPQARAPVADALDRIDRAADWRSWWSEAARESVRLTDHPGSPAAVPTHRIRSWQAVSGPLLGINIGGSYMRFVRVEDGDVISSQEAAVDSLRGVTFERFSAALASHELARDVRSVAIAWSAPRTKVGLRAMSILTQGAGEVSDLLDSGQLDARLTAALGRPVDSWNDGEAVAAAEVMYGGVRNGRPLLVFKLGTSFASGLAVDAARVVALPMQLSKCLPGTALVRTFAHPMVKLNGTARDALGAECLTKAFRLLSGRTEADFADYCATVAGNDSACLRLARTSAQVIAELADLVSRLWSPVDLVLTGKNLQEAHYRDTLATLTRQELANRPGGMFLRESDGDVSSSAALGALALSLGSAPISSDEKRRK